MSSKTSNPSYAGSVSFLPFHTATHTHLTFIATFSQVKPRRYCWKMCRVKMCRVAVEQSHSIPNRRGAKQLCLSPPPKNDVEAKASKMANSINTNTTNSTPLLRLLLTFSTAPSLRGDCERTSVIIGHPDHFRYSLTY